MTVGNEVNMKSYVKIIAILCAAALLCLAACACSVRRIDSSDGAQTNASGGEGRSASESKSASAESAGDEVPSTANEGDSSSEPAANSGEAQSEDASVTEQADAGGAGRNIVYVPADAEEAFAHTVFVGDSICSGFRVYGHMPDNNCLAVGNVGARSIFDYSFAVDGVDHDLITALKLVDPSFVVFSMGMNDINITDEDQFCANYDNILAKVHEALPDAKLFIASITPTLNAPSFKNSRIDSFNEAIKKHLEGTEYYYIDVASSFKDASSNSLIESFSGGDGIHLSSAAYAQFKSVVYDFYKSVGLAK